jgi:hypothetical protein
MPANPFPAVPEGDVTSEVPDGIQSSDGPRGGHHNLYDEGDKRPAIQSGDWQVKSVAHRPRDRGTT